MTKLNQIKSVVLCLVCSLLSSTGALATGALASDTFNPWRDWKGSESQLCELHQTYCHCGGYFEAPQFTPYPPDVDPRNFFGIADRYQYQIDTQARLYGNIIMRLGAIEVHGEQVTLDQENGTADFSENVEIRYPDLMVSGPKALFNLNTNKAVLEQAQFISYPTSIHGSAERIFMEHSGGPMHKVRFTNGRLTACPPTAEPDWELLGRDIKLDFNAGWGSMRDMRLKVGGVSTLYVPYFRFPLNDRRQSGFLFPTIDLSTPDLAFPYYINIAPNYDATITPRHVGDHGLMLGSEFRYLQNHSEGEILVNYLEDDETTKDTRTLFSVTQSSQFNQNWLLDIDANYVSDNQYFEDFGNSLAQSSASHLERRLLLRRLTNPWYLEARLESYQTIDSAIAPEDRPYRRLPDLTVSHYTQLFSNPSFEWINDLNYVYFAQPDADNPYAHRGVWRSRFRYNADWMWGYAHPEITLHQRTYRINGQSQDNPLEETYVIPISSLDTGIFFERSFNSGQANWIQTLEPRLFFAYVPYEERQKELPNFDTTEPTLDYSQLFRANRFAGQDRVGDTQQVTLGITQRLIDPTSGQERISLSIGQAYYLKDRRIQLDADEAIATESRSPLIGELRFMANQNVDFQLQANWDEVNRQIGSLRGNLSVRPQSKPRQHNVFNISYVYRNPIDDKTDGNQQITQQRSQQSQFSFARNLNERWTLLGKLHYDYDNHQSLEQITGFTYESCCWKTTVAYHKELRSKDDNPDVLAETDYAFLVEFQLKSIAGIGGGLSDFLATQIPGFHKIAY